GGRTRVHAMIDPTPKATPTLFNPPLRTIRNALPPRKTAPITSILPPLGTAVTMPHRFPQLVAASGTTPRRPALLAAHSRPGGLPLSASLRASWQANADPLRSRSRRGIA